MDGLFLLWFQLGIAWVVRRQLCSSVNLTFTPTSSFFYVDLLSELLYAVSHLHDYVTNEMHSDPIGTHCAVRETQLLYWD